MFLLGVTWLSRSVLRLLLLLLLLIITKQQFALKNVFTLFTCGLYLSFNLHFVIR